MVREGQRSSERQLNGRLYSGEKKPEDRSGQEGGAADSLRTSGKRGGRGQTC